MLRAIVAGSAKVLVLVLAGVALLPLVVAALGATFVRRLFLGLRLRAAWPPEKFVLFAYTQSETWAPYIEQQLLPRIADSAVVIDRSRENWKRAHPLEAAALDSWGGDRNYNPVALVVDRPWHVMVFRFYEGFQQRRHGKPEQLDALVAELLSTVDEKRRVSV